MRKKTGMRFLDEIYRVNNEMEKITRLNTLPHRIAVLTRIELLTQHQLALDYSWQSFEACWLKENGFDLTREIQRLGNSITGDITFTQECAEEIPREDA